MVGGEVTSRGKDCHASAGVAVPLPARLDPLLLHLQVGAASHLFTEERGPYRHSRDDGDAWLGGEGEGLRVRAEG